MVITQVSSSGSSVVKIDNDLDTAHQRFKSQNEYKKVKEIAIELSSYNHTSVFVGREFVLYSYEGIHFLSQILTTNDKYLTLVWRRISPLNLMNNYKDIIIKNFVKFIWDMLKALTAFNLNGFQHGDPTIDNIGIRNGNFVLYDYNLSSRVQHIEEDFENDLYKFFKSIRFHLQIEVEYPNLNYFVKKIVAKKNFDNVQQAIDYLDGLKIESLV